jgi:hypothetical protein
MSDSIAPPIGYNAGMDLNEFLRLLVSSLLVDESDAASFRDDFGGKTANQCANGLVERGVLTRWQADSLLASRYKGFFIDHFKLLELLSNGKDHIHAVAENLRTRKRVILAITPKREGVPFSYKVEKIPD